MAAHLFKVGNLLPVLRRLNPALAERLKEHENSDVCRKGTARPVNEILPGERAAIQYVSTRDKDRDDEVLVPDGCDLSDFKLAPQVLWAHNYSEPPIGSDQWIRSDGYGVLAKTVYATTPRAEEIWQLKRDGHLKTSSVGFVPMESVDRDGPGWAEVIKRLGKKWEIENPEEHFASVRRIYPKWLMLEHSDVPVPSNIHALVQAIGKGISLSPEIVRQIAKGEELTTEEETALYGIPDHPEKPYPNEHACRLVEPSEFDPDSFRRTTRSHEGKTYSVIIGRKKSDGKWDDQAFRYKKDVWTADQARSHCKANEGKFEAATDRDLIVVDVKATAALRRKRMKAMVVEAIETYRGRLERPER